MAALVGRRISTKPHLDSMAALVGRLISVYWDGEERYFIGTVKEFSASNESHLVVYEDGDQKWHHLENETITWPGGTPAFLRKAQADVGLNGGPSTRTSLHSSGDSPPNSPPSSRPVDLSSDISTNEGGGVHEDVYDEALRLSVAPPPVQHTGPPSDDIPRDLCCPLTLELFVDPVKTGHGQTYERAAIESWLKTHEADPIASLPVTTLCPDEDMRKRCDEVRAERSTVRAKPARAVQRKATKESVRATSEAAHRTRLS